MKAKQTPKKDNPSDWSLPRHRCRRERSNVCADVKTGPSLHNNEGINRRTHTPHLLSVDHAGRFHHSKAGDWSARRRVESRDKIDRSCYLCDHTDNKGHGQNPASSHYRYHGFSVGRHYRLSHHARLGISPGLLYSAQVSRTQPWGSKRFELLGWGDGIF